MTDLATDGSLQFTPEICAFYRVRKNCGA